MAQRVYSDAEIEARYVLHFNGVELQPYGSFGWRQKLSGDVASITARFAGGGDPFTLVDAAESDGRALASLGLSIDGDGANHLSFLYSGEASSDYERHSFVARYRFTF